MGILPDEKPNYFFNNLVLFISFFCFLDFRVNHGISELFAFYPYFYSYVKDCLIGLYGADFDTFFNGFFLITFTIYVVSSLVLPNIPHSLFIIRFLANLCSLGSAIIIELLWLLFFRYFNNFSEYFENKKYERRAKKEKNSRLKTWEQRLKTQEASLEKREASIKKWESEIRLKADELSRLEKQLKNYFQQKANILIMEKNKLGLQKNNAQSALSRDLNDLIGEKL